jgi:CPA1 family monovalent cation:H+ antiporter
VLAEFAEFRARLAKLPQLPDHLIGARVHHLHYGCARVFVDAQDDETSDLIVLTAFSVVLGTLVIQGLTLKPLLRALNLQDNDPVGQEVIAARERALSAGLGSFAHDSSPVCESVRIELSGYLANQQTNADTDMTTHSDRTRIYRGALNAARQEILTMRANDEIGDDAFHQIEEELDRLDIGVASERA